MKAGMSQYDSMRVLLSTLPPSVLHMHTIFKALRKTRQIPKRRQSNTFHIYQPLNLLATCVRESRWLSLLTLTAPAPPPLLDSTLILVPEALLSPSLFMLTCTFPPVAVDVEGSQRRESSTSPRCRLLAGIPWRSIKSKLYKEGEVTHRVRS